MSFNVFYALFVINDLPVFIYIIYTFFAMTNGHCFSVTNVLGHPFKWFAAVRACYIMIFHVSHLISTSWLICFLFFPSVDSHDRTLTIQQLSILGKSLLAQCWQEGKIPTKTHHHLAQSHWGFSRNID